MKKTKHILSFFIAVLTSGLLFQSCSDSKVIKEPEANSSNPSEQVMHHYLNITEALVKSDAKACVAAAKNLASLPVNTANPSWESIRETAREMAETENLETQRILLETLSDEVRTFTEGDEGRSMRLYQQYCPMALNGKGAYWISNKEEINNPYFGDAMLHCGSNEKKF